MAENKLANIVIGVNGTGMMGGAHAVRHATLGLPVVIGSRDPAKAQKLAREIGKPNVSGGSLAEMVEKANFIISAIPAASLTHFFDTHRDAIVGRGKMFVDLSVTFSRRGSESGHGLATANETPPPKVSDGPNWRGPYYDMCNYLKDRLNDPSTSFVKAWHNLIFYSITDNNVQPVECAGDPAAKEVAMAMMHAEGWEPLDCGGIADVPKVETGFHERRWRHPRHLEYNGPDHP